MDVSGIGGGAAHTHGLAKPAAPPAVSAPIGNFTVGASAVQDTVAGVLQQLAAPEISNLIQDIETHRLAVRADPPGDLLETAAAAARAGDVSRALSTLTELVRAHPGRAEALPHEPALASIQPQVEGLVQRLTSAARADAEAKIESASVQMRSGAHGSAHRVEMNPQNVLSIAERLVESGQYANIVLSAELAQAVIAYYGPFPVAGAGVALTGKGGRESAAPQARPDGKREAFAQVGRKLTARAGRMWKSAPLLLMLTVWMATGLLMGMLALLLRAISVESQVLDASFEVWGVGFLGLIGFGFYRSIRRLRF